MLTVTPDATFPGDMASQRHLVENRLKQCQGSSRDKTGRALFDEPGTEIYDVRCFKFPERFVPRVRRHKARDISVVLERVACDRVLAIGPLLFTDFQPFLHGLANRADLAASVI